jgi:hypothetical protein
VNYDLSLDLFGIFKRFLYQEEEVKREVVIHRRGGKERGCNSQKKK